MRPMAGETLKFFLRAGLEKFLWLVRYSNTSYWLYFQNGKKDFLESNLVTAFLILNCLAVTDKTDKKP